MEDTVEQTKGRTCNTCKQTDCVTFKYNGICPNTKNKFVPLVSEGSILPKCNTLILPKCNTPILPTYDELWFNVKLAHTDINIDGIRTIKDYASKRLQIIFQKEAIEALEKMVKEYEEKCSDKV